MILSRGILRRGSRAPVTILQVNVNNDVINTHNVLSITICPNNNTNIARVIY